MSMGSRLQVLRKKAGLTQEQLAEKLNVTRQSVTKWEGNDSVPDVDRLIGISQAFGVSIDFLIKGENEYISYNHSGIDDWEEIKMFLCRAKRNTYAAHGAETESSRRDSHDLAYENGNYSYLDSYFGGERFIGEEVLYVDRKPFWSMNYAGRVLDDNFSGDFLKESLMAVNMDKPYRGPEIYQNGIYTYHCKAKGPFDWFRGEEEIYFQGVKVYECLFHGGRVK